MEYTATPLNNMTLYTPVQCLVPTGFSMVYTLVPYPPQPQVISPFMQNPVMQKQMPMMPPMMHPRQMPLMQQKQMRFMPPPMVSRSPPVFVSNQPMAGHSASASTDSGDSMSEVCSRSQSRSTSVETLDSSMDIEMDAPKVAVENRSNLPVPKLTQSMTKREIVCATLDWLSQVFQDKFDTIGNRGEFVLRIKIKTREALDHFCPFIQQCVAEKLLCRMSCPISTKNGRKHIRGYLAYMEALDGRTANRILELFHKYNQEHNSVFAGEMVLNPKSVRPKRVR